MSTLDSLTLTRIPAQDEALRAEVRAFCAGFPVPGIN